MLGWFWVGVGLVLGWPRIGVGSVLVCYWSACGRLAPHTVLNDCSLCTMHGTGPPAGGLPGREHAAIGQDIGSGIGTER